MHNSCQCFQKKNFDIIFVTKDYGNTLPETLKQNGFTVEIIPSETTETEDLQLTIKAINQHKADIIITDSYKIDYNYQKALKQTSKPLLVIDDMLYTDKFYADVILNQNFGFTEEDYKNCTEGNTKLLIGPDYTLLRDEFQEKKPLKDLSKTDFYKILVTFGGADPHQETLKVLKALDAFDKDIELNLIVGNCFTFEDEVREIVANHSKKVNLYKNATNMSDIMLDSDISINAGGSTCWEIACLGLPNILIVIADNQSKLSNALHNYGSSINLGWYEDIKEQDIINTLQSITPEKFLAMKNKAYTLIDGKGAYRVAETLLNKAAIKL